MLQRIVEDFKDSTGTTLRMASLVALAGLATFVTLIFLCAALFVAIQQKYGPINACLAIAAVFFVIATVITVIYFVRKRRARARAAAAARQAAKSTTSSMLADPMLLAAGMQIVRAVGFKRLLPILAVGGLALGIYVNRNLQASEPDENDPPEDA